MNEGAFLINLQLCKKILVEYEILKKANLNNIQICTYKKYSSISRTCMQKDEYARAFIVGLEMDDYDFLLKDGSYFQFSFDKNDMDYILRMAYYPSINHVSYEDFLQEILGWGVNECGGEFIEDYQQYITEQETKFVTPIRYDYNSKIYKPLVHSASHVHLGCEENIRIPIDIILYPSAFVKIILQYFYYDKWKEKIEHGSSKDCFIGKAEKKIIDEQYFGFDEKKIPYISLQSS